MPIGVRNQRVLLLVAMLWLLPQHALCDERTFEDEFDVIENESDRNFVEDMMDRVRDRCTGIQATCLEDADARYCNKLLKRTPGCEALFGFGRTLVKKSAVPTVLPPAPEATVVVETFPPHPAPTSPLADMPRDGQMTGPVVSVPVPIGNGGLFSGAVAEQPVAVHPTVVVPAEVPASGPAVVKEEVPAAVAPDQVAPNAPMAVAAAPETKDISAAPSSPVMVAESPAGAPQAAASAPTAAPAVAETATQPTAAVIVASDAAPQPVPPEAKPLADIPRSESERVPASEAPAAASPAEIAAAPVVEAKP